MGSPTSEAGRDDDEELHTVTLTKEFEMQQIEVTQAQWFMVMGYNPSHFKSRNFCREQGTEINGTSLCPNYPVENVSWNDIQDFIGRLNQRNDGYNYRLPTLGMVAAPILGL